MDAGILRELALQISGIHTLVASEADTVQDSIETAKKSLVEETASSR